ncbi:MAG: hypothetical protein AAGN46_13805 [Acidobacteriota bacterium]
MIELPPLPPPAVAPHFPETLDTWLARRVHQLLGADPLLAAEVQAIDEIEFEQLYLGSVITAPSLAVSLEVYGPELAAGRRVQRTRVATSLVTLHLDAATTRDHYRSRLLGYVRDRILAATAQADPVFAWPESTICLNLVDIERVNAARDLPGGDGTLVISTLATTFTSHLSHDGRTTE